jgi:hypothetical protein
LSEVKPQVIPTANTAGMVAEISPNGAIVPCTGTNFSVRSIPGAVSMVVAIEVMQRTTKSNDRKWQESKQEIDRHARRSELPQPHRPTSDIAKSEKAAQEHKPTGTEKSNDQLLHHPEQAWPPKATSAYTIQKSAPVPLDCKASRTKARAPRQGTPVGGPANTGAGARATNYRDQKVN